MAPETSRNRKGREAQRDSGRKGEEGSGTNPRSKRKRVRGITL